MLTSTQRAMLCTSGDRANSDQRERFPGRRGWTGRGRADKPRGWEQRPGGECGERAGRGRAGRRPSPSTGRTSQTPVPLISCIVGRGNIDLPASGAWRSLTFPSHARAPIGPRALPSQRRPGRSVNGMTTTVLTPPSTPLPRPGTANTNNTPRGSTSFVHSTDPTLLFGALPCASQ